MLTGRKDAYLYEEHFDDISGYTDPHESKHDFFTVGHTSTSVSLASGLAKGRDLNGESGNVIAVIGDGSLSGGEALEGLDFAGEMDTNFIIVVNDNDMSIAENHGGLYKNLKLLRDTDGKAECNLFRAMGLDYVFVKGGNDIPSLIAAFRQVKDSTKPVVVHIVTQKGKGYELAEQHKEQWHWCMPFDPATGKTTVSFGGDGDFGSVDGRGRAAHQTVEFVLGNEGEALARLGKAPVVVPSLLLGSRTLGRQGAKVRVTGDQIRPVDVRRFVFGEFFSKTHARRRRSRPAAVERDDAGEKRGILFEKLAVEVPFKGRRRRHGNPFALRGALYSRPPSRALAAALGAAFSAFVRR